MQNVDGNYGNERTAKAVLKGHGRAVPNAKLSDREGSMDETALAVIGGRTRGLGSSGKQASCLDIEGPRTSPKTGAPNDRQGHQSVTPATDRGPDGSAPRRTTSISATSKSLPISWAGLPTRPPPRMSIAISYGWPRAGRRWEPPTSAPLPCGSSSRSH